ncbi:paired immunoglobulin-like type 2 receptor beta [Microtus oregoni]|uniref:paired immunoglobulin-like type 2 receptor beta n=1 Tax=Microtus oregoni TaxID=111838 RepID=UPI001BB14B2C|nr:paired immunoglobulin-like type 2 receptor beta [Microtus oregoni]
MAQLVSLPGGILDMACVLLLLLPAACLQAGNTAGSYRERPYGFDQPTHVSGVQGGSIEIPFTFYFPWKLAKNPQMRIFWRWKQYHGEFIYDSSSGFIHKHFKDRIFLNWTQPQTSGVLTILDLKEEDQAVYFCRVFMNVEKEDKKPEIFQSIKGTHLTITQEEHIPAVSTTMQSPSIITSAVTTAGLEDTEGQRNPSLVNMGAIVGVVVATAVLITPVYVMLIFLWWKTRPAD